jgi:hypothetical protein
MTIARFLKHGQLWYADLPEYLASGGSLADCLMVAGAPELLERLAGPEANKVDLAISTDWIPGFEAALHRLSKGSAQRGDGWAFYLAAVTPEALVCDPDGAGEAAAADVRWRQEQPVTGAADTMVVGLCPVNSWFFGGIHPDTIYIRRA